VVITMRDAYWERRDRRKGVTAEWIVPFKGRNSTGVYRQNFLWRSDNVFVMDNHRAAAWCWSQCVDPSSDHALVHIDRHWDALSSQLDTWLFLLSNGIPGSIDDYLAIAQDLDFGGKAPLFRWDNYLSIYLALTGQKVTKSFFATHGDGDRPNHSPMVELSSTELLACLPGAISDLRVPIIMNVDLDYFFGPGLEGDGEDEMAIRILDNAYVDRVTAEIAALDQAGRLPVITIALTATNDLTAGWGPAEELAMRMCAALGHSFALPSLGH
jgi:hypothetical protein